MPAASSRVATSFSTASWSDTEPAFGLGDRRHQAKAAVTARAERDRPRHWQAVSKRHRQMDGGLGEQVIRPDVVDGYLPRRIVRIRSVFVGGKHLAEMAERAP